MHLPRILIWSAIVVVCTAWPTLGQAGEIAILSDKTWDEFVPRGKEVDAIYGDFVLRNDKIVVVIANPVPGRHANMTVRDVGGCIIDLTARDQGSDQLSAYYPGARRFPYQLRGIGANGAVQSPATDESYSGPNLVLQCVAPATADRPEVQLTYTLRDGQEFVEIRSEFTNKSENPLKVTLVDDFRADRTFTTAAPGETDFVWFFDKWWGQAYGVTSSSALMRLTGSPAEPRAIEFRTDDMTTVELAPGKKIEVVRNLFPAANLIAARAIYERQVRASARIIPHRITVKDATGRPIAQADVEVTENGKPYGNARTAADGTVLLELPPGMYEAKVSSLAHGSKEVTIQSLTKDVTLKQLFVEFASAPRVVAEISDADGGPVPCKVQFIGVEGTKDPFFFPDTGERAVHNLYYSHNGRFTQEIPPGNYEVLVSYGPEYNAEKLRIEAKPGEAAPIRATLRRVVQSPGWISADFHSHSTPSGDNVSSQLGRVLNHLCENIEFAPCTEHNRLDTYAPHLKALGAEKLLATCTGIELTGVPGTINHQNAFPLAMKPRTQDNGAPQNDLDPEVQIKRLALWDNSSDKLVQQNHPDIGEMFFDRDGDGVPDSGFQGMFEYQDVIEVHPIHDVLSMNPLRIYTQIDKQTQAKSSMQYNNTIFNWLQLLNQGRRLPGVVNSDAHYNFHGSGWIRNYVKCQTDDPSKIDPMDIVHAAEQGHVIMSNGPYLEVALYDSDAGGAASGGARPRPDEPGGSPARRKAIPGDDLPLPGGFATLHVRVQCPNWFDVDRVQVLLNGRRDEKLNWTRSSNPDTFSDGVVKFERKIPLEFKTDTHVIVVAAGENSQLGPVLGPDLGKMHPTAVSNPIFVDADGGGFKPNGDTLGPPLPVKGGKKVEPPRP